MKNLLNILLTLFSGISCVISANLYYKSLEKDAIIVSNKEQIDKLIRLNNTLDSAEKLQPSSLFNFDLPNISTSGVVVVVVAVVLVGGSILLFSQIPSSTGINGIVKDSVSQAIVDLQQSGLTDAGDIVSKINKYTLDQFDIAQHQNSQAATRMLSYLGEIDKKLDTISRFLDQVSRGVFNSTSSSLPKANVFIDTVEKVTTEVATHAPEIAEKASKFSDFFG